MTISEDLTRKLIEQGCQGRELPRQGDEAHDKDPLIPRGMIDIKRLDSILDSSYERGGIFNVFSEDLAFALEKNIAIKHKNIIVWTTSADTPDGCIYLCYVSREKYNKLLNGVGN